MKKKDINSITVEWSKLTRSCGNLKLSVSTQVLLLSSLSCCCWRLHQTICCVCTWDCVCTCAGGCEKREVCVCVCVGSASGFRNLLWFMVKIHRPLPQPLVLMLLYKWLSVAITRMSDWFIDCSSICNISSLAMTVDKGLPDLLFLLHHSRF